MLNSISASRPSRPIRPSFFSQLEQQKDDKGKLIYPADVNWQVVTERDPVRRRLRRTPRTPMPNYNKSLDMLAKYLTRWTSARRTRHGRRVRQDSSAELQTVWDSK